MFKIWFRFTDGVPGLHDYVDCRTLGAAQRMWDILNAQEDVILVSSRP